jgi:uncharacterized protein (TIGR02270 family)
MDRDTAADSTREDEPLWDVLEEHLDEGAFCFGEVERVLDHPLFTLEQLESQFEDRLIAHLDGLVIGGRVVADRLLVPRLEAASASDGDHVSVATIALLRGPRSSAIGAGLFHELPVVRAATARGCVLARSPRLEAWAIDRFREKREPAHRAALMPIVGHVLELEVLHACLRSEDDELAAAAARVVSRGQPRSFLAVMEKLLGHRDPSVRDSALVACLAWGSPNAWKSCERLALDREVDAPLATYLYAALGGPKALDRLAKLLETPLRRSSVTAALGYGGSPRHVPVLLELLRSEDVLEAKRAAAALALVSGLDLADDAYAIAPEAALEDRAEADAALPAFEDDDLEADLVPPPEDALPTPNPSAIVEFWNRISPAFEERQRYLLGRAAVEPSDWLEVLAKAPLGARHVLAIAFGIRTGGRAWLDMRVFAEQQRSQLGALRALQRSAFERFYDR